VESSKIKKVWAVEANPRFLIQSPNLAVRVFSGLTTTSKGGGLMVVAKYKYKIVPSEILKLLLHWGA
jgi:hypothetical protein